MLNERIYGPDREAETIGKELEVKYKHPELVATQDAWTRHIRFEIAEANAMTAVGSFGKMAHYVGLPFFPIMTVYDFFIKRALDQLYYSLYWGAEFVVMGTPSGVTLSPEGAQHSWKSDIQIPNLITWEPLYAIEVDWILSDAIKRQMMNDNDGRRGVLIRAVTRGVQQKEMLQLLKTQARYKGHDAGALAPKGATGPARRTSPGRLVSTARRRRGPRGRLDGGYYLVDYRGYQGTSPVTAWCASSMGSLRRRRRGPKLLERGIYANVIHVSSPELLFGILGHERLPTSRTAWGRRHHLVPTAEADAAGSLASPAAGRNRRGVRRRGGPARQHRLDRRRAPGDPRGPQVLQVRPARRGLRVPAPGRRLHRRGLRQGLERDGPRGRARQRLDPRAGRRRPARCRHRRLARALARPADRMSDGPPEGRGPRTPPRSRPSTSCRRSASTTPRGSRYDVTSSRSRAAAPRSTTSWRSGTPCASSR